MEFIKIQIICFEGCIDIIININQITRIDVNVGRISLSDGQTFYITRDDMAELLKRIKAESEDKE